MSLSLLRKLTCVTLYPSKIYRRSHNNFSLARFGIGSSKSSPNPNDQKLVESHHHDDDISDDEFEDDMEEMFVKGPFNDQLEWGGPTRGGRRPEPTRYGDWERKGRATDF